jgi:gamma-tubulin complex component 5
MFFYANNAVTIDEAAFWEMSYMLRVRGSPVDSSSSFTNSESVKKKESGNQESTAAVAASKASNQGSVDISCPVFLKDIAMAIVSAGKSFQLIKHVQDVHRVEIHKGKQGLNVDQDTSCNSQCKFWPDTSSLRIQFGDPRCEYTVEELTGRFGNDSHEMGLLTLSEIFLICLSWILENGDHVYEYLRKFHADSTQPNKDFVRRQVQETEETCAENNSEKTWVKLLRNATSGRKYVGAAKILFRNTVITNESSSVHGGLNDASSNGVERYFPLSCCGNPAITAFKDMLQRNPNPWSELNISESFHLPPLNDEDMRRAIFANGHSAGTRTGGDTQSTTFFQRLDGTDYKYGFQFNNLEYVHQEDDRRILEDLYAFPTLLPCANVRISSYHSNLLMFSSWL